MKKITLSMVTLGMLVSGVAQAEPVQDNSFLVEEAYNQEPGVVQFINVWQKPKDGDDWTYTFINEIPVVSQSHQFSYEIPVEHNSAAKETEAADIKLNYRYEFSRSDASVITGRLSVTAPTGDYKKGLGSDTMGYEASLISSVAISDFWIQHWNMGFNITPDAKVASGNMADTTRFFWGSSNVFLITENFNFMLEIVGSSEEAISGPGTTTWSQETLVSPSIRYAINAGDWQFVPGLAMPMGVGPIAGDDQFLAYLSIEGQLW